MENIACIRDILQKISDLQIDAANKSQGIYVPKIKLTTLIKGLDVYQEQTLMRSVIACVNHRYINSNIDIDKLHNEYSIEEAEIYGLTPSGERCRCGSRI